jgi:NAD(P)H-dependent FMN reductase
VSYGSGAGGSRAVEHLRGVMGELKIYDLREQVLLPEYYTRLNDQGQYQFSDREVQAANTVLDEIVFWSEQMKTTREKLG